MRIRSRAIQRAGELLKEFDGRGDHMKKGEASPSRREIAEQVGMSVDQQKQAIRIANVPAEEFLGCPLELAA